MNDILDLAYKDTEDFDDFDYMEVRDYETELQELQESFDADFNKYFNKRLRKLNEAVEENSNPLLEMKKLKVPVKESKTDFVKRFQKSLKLLEN